MYSCTKFRFKTDDKLGPERVSYRGVKQGDGLSPLLFNISLMIYVIALIKIVGLS